MLGLKGGEQKVQDQHYLLFTWLPSRWKCHSSHCICCGIAEYIPNGIDGTHIAGRCFRATDSTQPAAGISVLRRKERERERNRARADKERYHSYISFNRYKISKQAKLFWKPFGEELWTENEVRRRPSLLSHRVPYSGTSTTLTDAKVLGLFVC